MTVDLRKANNVLEVHLARPTKFRHGGMELSRVHKSNSVFNKHSDFAMVYKSNHVFVTFDGRTVVIPPSNISLIEFVEEKTLSDA
jgi:hypothetical protein